MLKRFLAWLGIVDLGPQMFTVQLYRTGELHQTFTGTAEEVIDVAAGWRQLALTRPTVWRTTMVMHDKR